MGKNLLAGSLGAIYSLPISAETDAICWALELCKDHDWIPSKICCDFPGMANLIVKHHPCIASRISTELQKLKTLLKSFPNIFFVNIPWEDNNIANELASFGRLNPFLSLFYGAWTVQPGLKTFVLLETFSFTSLFFLYFPFC